MSSEEKADACFLQVRGWITWSGRFDGGMALGWEPMGFLGERVLGVIFDARAEGFDVVFFSWNCD